jgi:hypothetical protein
LPADRAAPIWRGKHRIRFIERSYQPSALYRRAPAHLSLNITNLTDLCYAANLDNSVFAPDHTGVIVAHAPAPQQALLTLSAAL